MRIRKAVIPAAGLGTRLLPTTKAQPKEMLPIVDKPTLQYIVEEAVSAGIEDILIVTGHNKRSIEDHFDYAVELEAELEKKQEEALLQELRRIGDMANIYYIRQKTALGLGHAIGCARTFVGLEPFAILLGDDVIVGKKPAIGQLIDAFNETRCSILGVQRVEQNAVSKYGIIRPEENSNHKYIHVSELVEKPAPEDAPSDIAILGRYVLTPNIFEVLARTPKGRGNEIQLTDALNLLVTGDDIYACEFEGTRYDVGDRMGFLRANVEIGMMHPEIGPVFASYLAALSLDPKQPLHGAIGAELKKRREKQS